MTTITLPPLPEPAATSVSWKIDGLDCPWQEWHDKHYPMPDKWDGSPPDVVTHVYTASQVEQIRRDAVLAALGAAVEACRDERIFGGDRDYTTAYNNAIQFAIAAIRALMPKEEN